MSMHFLGDFRMWKPRFQHPDEERSASAANVVARLKSDMLNWHIVMTDTDASAESSASM
jgi:hypothetical protein